MNIPTVDVLLRVAEHVLQIFKDPQIIERVDVARDRHRHRDDVRTLGCCSRNQGRDWIADVEIIDDGEALRQPMPVDFEHRHEPLRIKGAIFRRFLRIVAQVYLLALIFDPL